MVALDRHLAGLGAAHHDEVDHDIDHGQGRQQAGELQVHEQRGGDEEGDADDGREVLAEEAEPDHEQGVGAGEHGAHDAARAGPGVVAERQGDRALEGGRHGGGAAAVGQAVGEQRHGDARRDPADAEHRPDADQLEHRAAIAQRVDHAAEQDGLGQLDQAQGDVGDDQHRHHAALVAQEAQGAAIGAQQGPDRAGAVGHGARGFGQQECHRHRGRAGRRPVADRAIGLDQLGEIAVGAVRRGRQPLDQEAPAAGADQGCGVGDQAARKLEGDGVLDPAQLAAREHAGEAAPVRRVAVDEVGADHAGEAARAGFHGLGPTIGGGVLVGALGQEFQESIEIGRGGEQLVHQGHAPPGERRLGCQRHDRRAGEALIDQLAGRQSLAVGEPQGAHLAAGEDKDVGGGAAEVDEQAMPHPPCHQRGRGQPVGRGDSTRMSGGIRGRDEAQAPGPDHAVGPGPRCGKGGKQPGDAGLPVGEEVDQLAGHGDRHALWRLQLRTGLGEAVLQPVEALPERAGQLQRGDHPAVRGHLRRLEVRAAEVETGGQRGHRACLVLRATTR